MRKLAIAAICCAISAAASVPTVLKLDASKTGAPVQPTMYGLFFELKTALLSFLMPLPAGYLSER